MGPVAAVVRCVEFVTSVQAERKWREAIAAEKSWVRFQISNNTALPYFNIDYSYGIAV
jgi:hypothetical protein